MNNKGYAIEFSKPTGKRFFVIAAKNISPIHIGDYNTTSAGVLIEAIDANWVSLDCDITVKYDGSVYYISSESRNITLVLGRDMLIKRECESIITSGEYLRVLMGVDVD